jgi:hypothetical protein
MNLNWIPADTTPEAALVQLEIYRRMSPSRRMELALEMSDSLRKVVAAGVRQRHPEYTDDRARLAVIHLYLGDELFHQVYPGVDIRP